MGKQNEREMALNAIVPEYESQFFLVKNLFWDRIKYAVALGSICNDSRVLDAGCGMGYLLREIRKANRECPLTGIDFNKNIGSLRIEKCDFRVEDLRRLSFEDDSFDIVFALDILEHIEDARTAVESIRRVLKPGGALIVTGPTESFFYKFCRFLIKGTFSEKEGPGSGVHYHNINTLAAMIGGADFEKEKNIDLPRHFPFVLERVIKYTNKK